MACFVRAASRLGIFIPLEAEDFVEKALLSHWKIQTHEGIGAKVDAYMDSQPEELKNLLAKIIDEWNLRQSEAKAYLERSL
jgi:hypothetical protein